MSDKRFYKVVVVAATILIIMLVVGTIGAIGAAQVQGDDCIQLYVNGALAYESDACNVTEPTPTPEPTDAPTATPEPTVEPTPTDEPTGNGLPDPDDPPCETHDDREWHALHDAVNDCHYDHEHKDDPHELDHIFGTSFYDVAGGSISYPWETPGENERKHKAYGWLVRGNLDPSYSDDGRVFVKNIRIQSHLDLNQPGAVVRFHSSFFELQLCLKDDPDFCGLMRYGGHQDYGELRVDGNWVPLGDQDPEEYDGVEPPAVPERDYDNKLANRGHGETSPVVSWEGRFGNPENFVDGLPVSPHIYSGINHQSRDSWSLVNPADPFEVILSGGDNNNSSHLLRSYVLRLREIFAANGIIQYEGYTNRFGTQINTECSTPGPDCVPISLQNVPMLSSNSLFLRFPNEIREYDITFDGESSGWIDLSP